MTVVPLAHTPDEIGSRKNIPVQLGLPARQAALHLMLNGRIGAGIIRIMTKHTTIRAFAPQGPLPHHHEEAS